MVIDRAGRALKGASVYVVGSVGTAVTTDATGRFALDANVPDNGHYTAGDRPVTITLEPLGRK